ncbi:pyridoxal-phosphate dependent enzyme [Streptomyces syringium]|uniref:pyridoxal-phosphate dependent enzyme n=1 Tax=Streptomyces syringium TaxID=76729 RepID=UPI003AAC2801
MLFDTMTDAIGHTPLVRLRLGEERGVEVYAKLELQNPFAMKDRVARNIVLEARRLGTLLPGAPIIESSSGTMALGVALVGRSLGHAVHIVTDPRIDPITLAKLRALGCEVHIVEAMTSHGWQSARLERLEELMRDLPGAFWPQQYTNPDNPGAYRTLAEELLRDLGGFDVLVGATGSGGSLCGSARALKESLPGLRVVGVDCVGSALFGQPDVPQRLQSGLGNSLLPKNLDRSLIDEVHWLNDHEAFAAAWDLAREQQIFAGNTSGSVYRVLGSLAATAAPGTRVVGIFPDRGDRYADTVYSDEHWARHDLSELPTAPAPRAVRPGDTALTWSHMPFQAPGELRRHLLFVESNTTGTGMLALGLARELDTVPVLLTGDPDRYAGLADTGCEIIVCDANSRAELRRVIQERFRREEIAGITTTSDFYVPVVAELAHWLGLPGNPVEAMATCRNKATLRETLAAAGVRQPRFAVVREADQVAAAVARVGLPCVVKPVDDSGSTNVLLCADEATATAHAARILAVRTNVRGLPTAGSALVEEYVDAPEFSVEMFSWDGGTECVGITAKSVTDGPHFVEHRHIFPADLPPATAEEITETVRAALDAAGVRLGATHTEVKLTAAGASVIEINPRLAGGMIPELVRRAGGVRLLEQQLRVAVGLPPELKPDTHGYAGIQFLLAPADGLLTAVEGTDAVRALPGIEAVTLTAAPGDTVRTARGAADRLGHVIACAGSGRRVAGALDAALRRIALTVEN